MNNTDFDKRVETIFWSGDGPPRWSEAIQRAVAELPADKLGAFLFHKSEVVRRAVLERIARES